jgi:WD40 repeat protein
LAKNKPKAETKKRAKKIMHDSDGQESDYKDDDGHHGDDANDQEGDGADRHDGLDDTIEHLSQMSIKLIDLNLVLARLPKWGGQVIYNSATVNLTNTCTIDYFLLAMWLSTKLSNISVQGSPIKCFISVSDEVLVSFSFDKTIQLWNVTNGRVTKVITEGVDFVECLLVLENGQLAVGEIAWLIKIWYMQTGSLVTYVPGHEDVVTSLVNLKEGHIHNHKNLESRKSRRLCFAWYTQRSL